jgi:hypothetical protein
LETTTETLKREFEEEIHAKIEVDDKKIDLEFCWVSLEELKNGLKVYPIELIPHILSNTNETVHFISKQI